MGRWTIEDAGSHEKIVVLDDKLFAGGPERYMMDAHNADCDAYELRIAELTAELARVKAESLRVVEAEDNGNLHDWYMTPTGLGYPDKDRKGNNCIESETSYHRLDECTPVRLELWDRPC